jgi:MFS family permease
MYQYGLYSVVPNVFNEDLQRHFCINAAETGGLIGAFYIAYTPAQIPVGILIDRFSVRLLITLSFLIISLGAIVFAKTDSYSIAYIAQMIIGFGCAFSFTGIIKVSNEVFSREKAAFMSSLSVALGGLSAVAMSPLFAYLSALSSWDKVVFWFGIVGVVLAIVGFLATKEEVKTADPKEEIGVIESLKVILSNKQFILMGLFSMAILSPFLSFSNAWGASFIKCIYGIGNVEAASTISAMNFGLIFGVPLIVSLAAKFESYKKVMAYCSYILAALFGFAIFVKTNVFILGGALFLIGIVMNCEFLTFPAAISLASPKIAGTLTSVINTIIMAGSATLIPAIGAVMDLSRSAPQAAYSPDDYKRGMIVLMAFLVFAIIVVQFIKDEYRKSSEKKTKNS